MQRIMGLDFGGKRIGVALSDPMGYSAQPYGTVHRKKRLLPEVVKEIADIATQNEVGKFVMGLPLHMGGDESIGSQKAREFAALLHEATGLEIIMEDERLTTAMAKRTLIEGDVSREKRKNVIDTVAAVIILQSYLERQRND